MSPKPIWPDTSAPDASTSFMYSKVDLDVHRSTKSTIQTRHAVVHNDVIDALDASRIHRVINVEVYGSNGRITLSYLITYGKKLPLSSDSIRLALNNASKSVLSDMSIFDLTSASDLATIISSPFGRVKESKG